MCVCVRCASNEKGSTFIHHQIGRTYISIIQLDTEVMREVVLSVNVFSCCERKREREERRVYASAERVGYFGLTLGLALSLLIAQDCSVEISSVH